MQVCNVFSHVCVSLCLCVCLSVCVSVCLFVCLSVCLCLYGHRSVHLSVWFYVSNTVAQAGGLHSTEMCSCCKRFLTNNHNHNVTQSIFKPYYFLFRTTETYWFTIQYLIDKLLIFYVQYVTLLYEAITSMVIELYIFRLWKQANFLKVICTTILVITNKFIVLP